ncbi:hypothetical protein CWS72_24015 [Telmatospirillum siberiense]|uniref:Uncharacterized protein n=1 Tax=Telmatospirillum siberiense TaxID=382514 RepID=A0A2N3PNI6_9PROT|nr:hypothetical protein CWS72_24015 [Telmatospirillum siberiense]
MAAGDVDLCRGVGANIAVRCRPAMGQRFVFGSLSGEPFVGMQPPDLAGIASMRWSASMVNRKELVLIADPMSPAGIGRLPGAAPALLLHLPLLTPHVRRIFVRHEQATRLAIRIVTVDEDGAFQGVSKQAALNLALHVQLE